MRQRDQRLAQSGPDLSIAANHASGKHENFLVGIGIACAAAQAGTLFLPAYPDHVLVIDEATQKVLDTIPTQAGLPTSIRLSLDRKTIFIGTNDHNGISVIDIASHKVLNHFILNGGNRQVRFNSFAADPTDKLIYTVVTEVVKQIDRFEVGKPKYAVIDLEQQKITRTADVPEEDVDAVTGFMRGLMYVSPDGKYLYQFRDHVAILDTTNFKVVDRIELAKPDFPGLSDVGMGPVMQSVSEPGFYTSLFNAEDPAVHRKMFGIARFDLNSRAFEFKADRPDAGRNDGNGSVARSQNSLHGGDQRGARDAAMRVLGFRSGVQSAHHEQRVSLPSALQLRHVQRRQGTLYLWRRVSD